MEITFEQIGGLDIHKKVVVACRKRRKESGRLEAETRSFGTMTRDLLSLLDWLNEWSVTHVAMESTGDYWKPVHNILEGHIEVWLVNAQHVKNVPGRKTDVKDAEWLAHLMIHGLLKASFIPPQGQRDLRDLTRQRNTLVRERANVVNRLQKVLESANIKLGDVASDVNGVSGKLMLKAIVAGNADAEVISELAKGRLRNKKEQLTQALTGRVREHHRFMLAQHLMHIDHMDEQVEAFDEQIDQQMPKLPGEGESGEAFETAVKRISQIPGMGPTSTHKVLAEIGTNMAVFPSAGHLASWAGLCPGNYRSAGKRISGRIGPGHRPVRTVMIQCAHAAVSAKDSDFAVEYQRIMSRRGKKRALVAVAHSLMRTMFHMLKNGVDYAPPDRTKFNAKQHQATTDHLVKRFAKLGYQVALTPIA